MVQKNEVVALVLAAGKGSRMRSPLPKVLHKILGKSMITHVLECLLKSRVNFLFPVMSPLPENNPVRQEVERIAHHNHTSIITHVFQDPPLGTGHAAQLGLQAIEANLDWTALDQKDCHIIVVYGDTPCLQVQSMKELIHFHNEHQADITLVAFEPEDPTGYGRILQEKGVFKTIREDKDCLPEERHIKLCYSGIMVIRFSVLKQSLPNIKNNNRQGEYYLTDVPSIAVNGGARVALFTKMEPWEVMGVNTPEQLNACEKALMRI